MSVPQETKATHTPGPWRVAQEGNELCVIAAAARDGNFSWPEFIADVFPLPLEEEETTRANADLIAAAPDLLAACEEALVIATCQCDEAWTSRGLHVANSACYLEAELRAAIAKAKGEAS